MQNRKTNYSCGVPYNCTLYLPNGNIKIVLVQSGTNVLYIYQMLRLLAVVESSTNVLYTCPVQMYFR